MIWDSSSRDGGIAQLVERLPCTQEVSGSSPLTSTESVIEERCSEAKKRPVIYTPVSQFLVANVFSM